MAIKKRSTAKRATTSAAAKKTATNAATPPAARAPARKAVAKKAARKSAVRGATKAKVEVVEEIDEAPPPGGRALVIVESPAKAKTIGKYLGSGFVVKATVGHVRDLPEKKLGIDLDKNFTPDYVTIEGKEPVLTELKKTARAAREVFIATDPDREGEAIGWHVTEFFAHPPRTAVTAPIRRVMFHEITKEGVKAAMAQPRDIDKHKVDAQQARRVLDRLVGYKASPILWKTVKKGLSAGRVQTVALRLIVEREREIRAFVPTEYWSIAAQLEQGGQKFGAKLHQVDGKKTEIPNESEARRIVADVDGYKTFAVTEVKRRERRKNPQAPFTTSTLQQDAAKKLGFGSKRTMRLAQDLYEGMDVGEESATGLITYMRTDSSRVAESAALAARDVLRAAYGESYLATEPQFYGKSGANTQDAHEGVRPTDPSRRPETVRKYLTADQYKLYELVWQRFMASQMAPAVFDTTTVDFLMAGKTTPDRSYLFRATGSVVKFQGFLALYRETREETEAKALEDEQELPVLEVGNKVPVREIVPNQHFTSPPPRFSEASLVKELERLGIGRPSTYASIISVLADRRYVLLEQRRFFPTSLGESVEKVMIKKFPDIFNVAFTSQMEGELDKIEEGAMRWQHAMKDFWTPFQKTLNDNDLDSLIGEAYDLSALATERCPLDGGKLVPKGGFFGPFVACENHPKNCKYTRPVTGERKPAQMTDYACPTCGAPMVVRHGRGGDFLGCSTFPKCRGTKSMPTGVLCPKDGGEIAERKSKKRGKTFYGCENYPTCDFVCWDKPVKIACPECGFVGAEAKKRAAGLYYKCIKCSNEWDRADEGAEAVEVEAAVA
jgi:DNA topoisomerase I